MECSESRLWNAAKNFCKTIITESEVWVNPAVYAAGFLHVQTATNNDMISG